MKHLFFILTIFFSLIVKICFSQNITPNNKYNFSKSDESDSYLRVEMTLVDTLPVSCVCGQVIGDTTKNNVYPSVYKFKVDTIYHGLYTNKYIYVCSHSVNIALEHKEHNDMFWWCLWKTDKFFDNLPIYVQGCNF